jgi:hypothetical protein
MYVCTFRMYIQDWKAFGPKASLPRHSGTYIPPASVKSIRARSTVQKMSTEHDAQMHRQSSRASSSSSSTFPLPWSGLDQDQHPVQILPCLYMYISQSLPVIILISFPRSAMSSLSTDVQGGLVDACFVQAIMQK